MKRYLSFKADWCLVGPSDSHAPLIKMMDIAKRRYRLTWEFKMDDDGIWAKQIADHFNKAQTKRQLRREANYIGEFLLGLCYGLTQSTFSQR